VLDHQHSVAGIDEALQAVQEPPHVLEVESRRRLVEQVQRSSGCRALQLGGELHPLRLAA
jgi:hypothetical protein